MSTAKTKASWQVKAKGIWDEFIHNPSFTLKEQLGYSSGIFGNSMAQDVEAYALTLFLTGYTEKKGIAEALKDHGILLEALRAEVGKDEYDDFDLICHLAFDQKPLTKQERIEKMYEELHKTHAVSLKEYLEAQMQTISIDDAKDQLANDILELDERIGSLTAEREAFIQEWRNKISEEMVEVDRSLTSTKRQYDKQVQLLEYVCLRAPCNAVVHQIAEFAPGSGVREAEALITLIPLDGDIELEAEIRPEDIGNVKVGAEARIKLTAYPFQKYGTLDGVVKNISEDTLDRQVGGMQVKYYRARLTVSGRLRPVKNDLRLRNFRLIPGMETQCEIKCGRRRVIEYVLYPLIKAMDETAREP